MGGGLKEYSQVSQPENHRVSVLLPLPLGVCEHQLMDGGCPLAELQPGAGALLLSPKWAFSPW